MTVITFSDQSLYERAAKANLRKVLKKGSARKTTTLDRTSKTAGMPKLYNIRFADTVSAVRA